MITEQCIRSNMLPRWRTIHLNHIRQLRRMIREGRQVIDAKICLKQAQHRAAKARQAWFAAA